MYGSEPSYSPYTQSPSPAGFGNPMTPGSIAPVSPAYNPLTPGAGMEETQADWVTTDIEVRINENHEVSLLNVVLFCCQATSLQRHPTLVLFGIRFDTLSKESALKLCEGLWRHVQSRLYFFLLL